MADDDEAIQGPLQLRTDRGEAGMVHSSFFEKEQLKMAATLQERASKLGVELQTRLRGDIQRSEEVLNENFRRELEAEREERLAAARARNAAPRPTSESDDEERGGDRGRRIRYERKHSRRSVSRERGRRRRSDSRERDRRRRSDSRERDRRRQRSSSAEKRRRRRHDYQDRRSRSRSRRRSSHERRKERSSSSEGRSDDERHRRHRHHPPKSKEKVEGGKDS